MNNALAEHPSKRASGILPAESRGLSKSRFMAGMQCHKRLYLETFQRELAESTDESGQAILEAGQAVGALARNRFPGGTLIGEDLDWISAERATREALRNQKVPAIFEPALDFDGVRIRADILARSQDGRRDLIEVKSTLDATPAHEWDLTIQYHVLRGAGIPTASERGPKSCPRRQPNRPHVRAVQDFASDGIF